MSAVKTVHDLETDAKGLAQSIKSVYDKGSSATVEELEQAQADTTRLDELADRLEKITGKDARERATKALGRLAGVGSILAGMRPDFTPAAGGDGDTLTGGNGEEAHGFTASRKSYGEMFTGDERVQSYLKALMPSGRVPERTPINTPTVLLGSILKALVRSGDTAAGGALVYADQRRDLVIPYLYPALRVRDVMTVLPTNSDRIEYARVTSDSVNAAAEVAEATSVSTGLKPESTLVTEPVEDTVKTIAHWLPATKQVLQDAPQMRSIIDAFLRGGVEDRLARQVLNGDGLSGRIKGVNRRADEGVQEQAFSTSVLRTLRLAIGKVRALGLEPNGIIMNPADWMEVELATDDSGRYYFGGPVSAAAPRVWGQRVVETAAQPEGQAVVGDLTTAVIWDREQATITMTNSHEDYFVRNLVAILCELRAGFGLLRPEALVIADLVSGS
jgi:HK97 family phage major capsid protein